MKESAKGRFFENLFLAFDPVLIPLQELEMLASAWEASQGRVARMVARARASRQKRLGLEVHTTHFSVAVLWGAFHRLQSDVY